MLVQAESDGSSEMSDDALHKLVSRLVEAGKDLEDDDLNTACAVQVQNMSCLLHS